MDGHLFFHKKEKKRIMHFLSFFQISKSYVEAMSTSELQRCYAVHRKRFPPFWKPLSKHQGTARLQVIACCYLFLFPDYHTQLQTARVHVRNDYFYDYTQTADYRGDDAILVFRHPQEGYLFTVPEILEILHGNLSNSDADYDVQYNICTIRKFFQLPRNPYTGLPFSKSEMEQIISQLLLFVAIHDPSFSTPYYEVFLYLAHYPEIFQHCLPSSKTTYQITQFLETFMNNHGLVFRDRYQLKPQFKLCENLSQWEPSSISAKQKKSRKIELFLRELIAHY